ncbi:MAG: SDR family NAD(P)-dependent oxidoreductase, partial [Acidobacteriota bacterium]|nr:SDR family NAD(P)-dependent oxidoreductase [Acidobacteriota bacterium]
MNDRFKGQAAIVTGSASGLGFGIARRLIEEGARVSLWDRNRDALQKAAAELGSTNICAVDVTDAEAVEKAARDTVEALGSLDILIANA